MVERALTAMDVGAPMGLAEEENRFSGNEGWRSGSNGGAGRLRRLAERQRDGGGLRGLVGGLRELAR